MSHFAVMVVIEPGEIKTMADVEPVVAQMMRPYQENNMGDCPEEFLKFHDVEDEYRKEWETKKTEQVKLEDGTLVSPYDKMFATGPWQSDYKIPKHLKKVKVPFKEIYPKFSTFMKEWVGYSKKDPKKRRYGYWENPNRKWDYWIIGGRFSGKFPIKPGSQQILGEPDFWDSETPDKNFTDVVRVKDLDRDVIAEKTRTKMEKFWKNWELLKTGSLHDKDDPWASYNARYTANDTGLIKVIKENETPPDGWILNNNEWSKLNATDERSRWYDAFNPIGYDEFAKENSWAFNPVRVYAVLNKDGWHAPGEMGWWGCSSDEMDDRKNFHTTFWSKHINSLDPHTVLVVVDCHI